MKIYSIIKITKTINGFLKPKPKTIFKKKNKKKKIISETKISNVIPPETEKIIRQAEQNIVQEKENPQNFEEPLILMDQESAPNSEKINSFNYKFKIKPEIKDRMINELYIYLKKKVRKNTLKLIIDEQVEIKNLKNQINFLKHNENKLVGNYQILKNNYDSSIENYEKLKISKEELTIENRELKINNQDLENNLNQISRSEEDLSIENKQLIINNEYLENKFAQASESKDELEIENKELKNDLKEKELNLNESLEKNRSYEVNNAELKNTVSRYIVNYKKLQENINLNEKSENLKLDEGTQKVKFYQEENIRLSSDLVSTQKKYEVIKKNFSDMELEKNKIFKQIQELNNSLSKTNIVGTPFTKELINEDSINSKVLNDITKNNLEEDLKTSKPEDDLDGEINDIFK